MGGHVLRVWRGWSDFGISPGRLETFLGNGRIVVEMDEVMGDARMPRLALENRLEDGCAFELVGIGLVIGRGRDVQRDSVADLGFIIRRIPLRQGLHRLQISLHARPMRGLVVIGIEHGESIDEIALALRLGTDGLPLLDGSEALREIARGRRCVRIVEQTQSDPPVGDGAVGVGFEDLLEQFLQFPIPERMLVSHRAVKSPLRRLIARGREVDGAKSLVGFFLGVGWRVPNPDCHESDSCREQRPDHGPPRLDVEFWDDCKNAPHALC